MILLWIAALAGLGLALPFLIEAARRPMDDTARASAPGKFIALSQGKTHYRWVGPPEGPVVICIHGLTTPCFVWDDLAQGLARKGYRVLAYDLYGRGYSDRPAGPQNADFFLRQLKELRKALGLAGEYDVIGYSMGGAIATACAARDPQHVRRVVLLAPAGMQPVGDGLMTRLIHMPLIGRWLMLLRYPAILRQGFRAEARRPEYRPDIANQQEAELSRRGFIPAVHASLRDLLNRDMNQEHAIIARTGTPVLAIWGAQDDVIPRTAKDRLSAWNGAVTHHVIDDAAHGLTYTHSAQILPLVARFLNAKG